MWLENLSELKLSVSIHASLVSRTLKKVSKNGAEDAFVTMWYAFLPLKSTILSISIEAEPTVRNCQRTLNCNTSPGENAVFVSCSHANAGATISGTFAGTAGSVSLDG